MSSLFISTEITNLTLQREMIPSPNFFLKETTFKSFKDHVIFEKKRKWSRKMAYLILFTLQNKWLEKYQESKITVTKD